MLALSVVWIAVMKPGKLAISAAWLSSMLALLSITNRKSTFLQPMAGAPVVSPVSPPMSNLTASVVGVPVASVAG